MVTKSFTARYSSDMRLSMTTTRPGTISLLVGVPFSFFVVSGARLKTGSIFGCNTFRPIDSMSGDKGLWVPGDCLTTQTTIATAYSPQSSDSDKPIGSVR